MDIDFVQEKENYGKMDGKLSTQLLNILSTLQETGFFEAQTKENFLR